MEDLTGMQLGQYRIVAPLGEGGMAAVYKAYQSSMDRYVALKVLPRHFASDPEFTGRFEQEARVIARSSQVVSSRKPGSSHSFSMCMSSLYMTSVLLRGTPISSCLSLRLALLLNS